MDLELISPMPLRVSINLPALLVPGVPAELLLGVTGTSLGFGGVFLGGFSWAWGWVQCAAVLALSHGSVPSTSNPSWMGEILPELGRFGGFPQISASSFSKLCSSALTSVLWSWRQAGAWCPPNPTGVFIWEDAWGVP